MPSPVKPTGDRSRLLGQSTPPDPSWPPRPFVVAPAGQGPYQVQQMAQDRGGAEASGSGTSLLAAEGQGQPSTSQSTFTPAVGRGTPAEPLPRTGEPAVAENFPAGVPAEAGSPAYRYRYGDLGFLKYLLKNPSCSLYFPPAGSTIREIECAGKNYAIDYVARTVRRVGAPPSLQSRLSSSLGRPSTAQFLQETIFQSEEIQMTRIRFCAVLFCEHLNEGQTEAAVELANQVPQILGMSPSARDPEDPQGKNTLMHQVCQYGSPLLVESLLSISGVSAYLGRTDQQGRTPVDYLALRPEMADLLARSPVLQGCYGALDAHGHSPIHHALREGCIGNVLAMLKFAPDVMSMRPMGGRPGDTIYDVLVQKLCIDGSPVQVEDLLGIAGVAAYLGRIDRNELTLIDYLARRPDMTGLLERSSVLQDRYSVLNGYGYSPIHYALGGGAIENALVMLQSAPNVLAMRPIGGEPGNTIYDSLMHKLCLDGSPALVERLLGLSGVAAYLGRTSFEGLTLVDYLVRWPDMADVLGRATVLQGFYGVLDGNGYSLIHHVLREGYIDNALAMLRSAPHVLAMCPIGGRPGDTIYHALMASCSVGQLAQASHLPGIGDFVGLANANGQTALDIIGSRGLLTACAKQDGVMRIIVTRDSPPSWFMSRDADGYTPMHHAIMGGCFWNCVTIQRCFPACGRIRTRDGRSCRYLIMAQSAFTAQQKERLIRGPRAKER